MFFYLYVHLKVLIGSLCLKTHQDFSIHLMCQTIQKKKILILLCLVKTLIHLWYQNKKKLLHLNEITKAPHVSSKLLGKNSSDGTKSRTALI